MRFITADLRALRARRRQLHETFSRFLKLVDDAKSRVKEADFRDIKRRLDAREKLTLVDVREESEWAHGHLPGAVHLGKGIIERDIEQAIPDKDAPLVLYCGGGFRSALVADNLQKMGYTNVISMDGGWRGWTDGRLSLRKARRRLRRAASYGKRRSRPLTRFSGLPYGSSSSVRAQNLSLLGARYLQEVFMACYYVRLLGRGPTGRTPHC